MKKEITIAVLALFTLGVFGAVAQVAKIDGQSFTVDAPKTDGVAENPDGAWSKGGVAGATLSQTALSNWAAGGDGSVAFDLMFNYGINYKKDKHLWQSRLELAYGMNHSQSNGAQKTNDRIFLASMYGYQLSRTWYLAALMNFNTQFANGFDYKTDPKTFRSQFMAPGYLSAGVGVAWRPKTWFTATFSPATWRGTFVLNETLSNMGAYGVEPGKRVLHEFGANVRFEVNYDIAKTINLYSRLDLYSNYLRNPQNVDVRWDTMITAKIYKWLSANLSVGMIYDDDVKFPRADGTMGGAKLQVRQTLGLGFQAAF